MSTTGASGPPSTRPAGAAAALPGLSLVVGSVVGTALWTSLGVLDAVPGPGGAVRLAALPSVGLWVALAAVSSLTAWGIDVALRARTDGSGTSVPHSVLAPLLASGVLVLPYLPWLPDLFPILTVLAGPLRGVIWLVIGAETLRRVIVAGRRPRRDRGRSDTPGARPRRRSAVAVASVLFVAGSVLAGSVAARLTGTALYPAGDEPHYLVMAQSLWRDGDLAIENNHEREDYREYYTAVRGLEPHYLTRGTDGEIYSVHPVGLPVLLAPVYALGGYTATRVAMIAISSAALALVAWWLLHVGLPRRAAVIGWLGVAATAPYLFFSFAVYPETVAGLLVVLAWVSWTTAAERVPARSSPRPWLGVGLAAAALPWLSTKYAPMAAALVGLALARAWGLGEARVDPRRARAASTAILLPFALSLVAWFGFFAAVWGTPWPDAPYGGNAQTHPARLTSGLPGLLLDQEYGVVPNAPIYAAALVGFWTMWHDRRRGRRAAVELALLGLALVGTVGAFHLWWGGSAPPGRPVVSFLPLLAIPLAWLYASGARGDATRTLVRLTLTFSIGIALVFALAREGLLLANGRDGSAALLEHLSPIWPLSALLPTFIDVPVWQPVPATIVWIGAGLLVTRLLLRLDRVTPTTVATATGVVTAAALAVGVVVPAVGLPAPARDPIATRWQIGFVDRYDATRRPVGVSYDPVRSTPAPELLSRFAYVIAPPSGAGSGPEPDLLHGHRLALAAGTYAVEMTGRSADGDPDGGLSLMVGRFGAPLSRWEVPRLEASPWHTTFTIAVDATYLGFIVSESLEHARPELVVRPVTVTDAHRRPRHPQVLGTLRTPTGTYYFFDEGLWIEPGRFWTRAGHETWFAVSPPDGTDLASVRTAILDIHCGEADNQLTIESAAGREVVGLPAGTRREVVVPVAHGLATLRLHTATGFVPAELRPGQTDDTRALGCQIVGIEWTGSP